MSLPHTRGDEPVEITPYKQTDPRLPHTRGDEP